MSERVIAHPGRWRRAWSRRPGRIRWDRTLRRALLPLLLLGLWQFAATEGYFDPSFVPAPSVVLDSDVAVDVRAALVARLVFGHMA